MRGRGGDGRFVPLLAAGLSEETESCAVPTPPTNSGPGDGARSEHHKKLLIVSGFVSIGLVRREEALGILGLQLADAKDFATVRRAYHRRMRAVHPDLNPAPEAPEAAAMVSAAYDLLDRAYRAQRTAQANRDAAAARSNDTARQGGPRARVLNDTTVTMMGTPAEVFALTRAAAERIGEVSSIDTSAAMLLVVAEFLHMAPCQVTLSVIGRAADRTHIRCAVESLSGGETPPLAAVTRLVAQKLLEVSKGAAPTASNA